jgi:hypothetical protein
MGVVTCDEAFVSSHGTGEHLAFAFGRIEPVSQVMEIEYQIEITVIFWVGRPSGGL